ncbi:hypothetical protein MCU_00012 [Bartonella elizabethae Re6043vi]|uniref:Uncharacterized protein n=2 Tax=Bartonella elizabethae TaxID=807 RepID=J0R9E3_BAREL|nr:hypothetical protein MCU_00012 [Bartonella elizabethae Re6043vi]EJF95306.1 hypothetical protein MEE_01141 [Bartonella elizabethae F9251 = ATCC 49927]
MLCLYYIDWGVEALEVVFLLCLLSINFDGSCRESGIVAVKRDCAFVYDIMEKAAEDCGKVCVKERFFMG